MTPPTGRTQKVTYDAPVGSIDLAAFNDAGEAYAIWPCTDCLPWHAEVVIDEDGDVLVREWHAVACQSFQELLKDDPD
jgi:hypothetical protein